MNLNRTLILLFAAFLTFAPARISAANVNVMEDVTSDATWTAENTYILRSIIYVRNGATLTIEPGTVVKGGTSELVARDGIPNLVSGLWVTRGSKLMASGTKEKPIIFTYEGDDVSNANDVPYNTSGQWGGVVLCGKALINSASYAEGNAATPKYERFEGTTTDGIEGAHLFGGSEDGDNSGVLRYVSIRYPGNVFAPGRELNGLTMAGVGSATTIEYVEVVNSSDDGFEWWGGNVNTKYLAAVFCEDDDFDTDQGYRGTNQFWFGIKPPWNGSSDSRGFETDGDLNQNASGEEPKSQWKVSNATMIGRGTGDAGFGGGIAWNARDEAAPTVINSVFVGFAAGVKVDADGIAEFDGGMADLRGSLFEVPEGKGTSDGTGAYLFTDVGRGNRIGEVMLGGVSYTNNMALDPRPKSGSVALNDAVTVGEGLMQTTYRGAFSADALWTAGWTYLDQAGFTPRITVALELTVGLIDGKIEIRFPTEVGKSYRVQSSSDFLTWINVDRFALTGTGGELMYSEAMEMNTHKFFRVIVP